MIEDIWFILHSLQFLDDVHQQLSSLCLSPKPSSQMRLHVREKGDEYLY